MNFTICIIDVLSCSLNQNTIIIQSIHNVIGCKLPIHVSAIQSMS